MARASIAELLAVPAEEQDAEWLQTSLQAAIELELATIPTYLSGMWSIKDPSAEPDEPAGGPARRRQLSHDFSVPLASLRQR